MCVHHLNRIATVAMLAAAILSMVAGCGGSLDDAGSRSGNVDIEAGRAAYEATCAACHGPEGRGTSNGPPLVDRVYEPSHHGDAAFLLAVVRGVPEHHWNFGDMPPQPGVSAVDVDNIVAYVRSLQRAAGIT